MSITKKVLKKHLCAACAHRVRNLRPTQEDFGVDRRMTPGALLDKTINLTYDLDAFVRDVRDNATIVIMDGVEGDTSDLQPCTMRSDKTVKSTFTLPGWVVHNADGRMDILDDVRHFIKKYKKNECKKNLYISFTHYFDEMVNSIENGNIQTALDFTRTLEIITSDSKRELRGAIHLNRVRNEILTLTQRFDDMGIKWIDADYKE